MCVCTYIYIYTYYINIYIYLCISVYIYICIYIQIYIYKCTYNSTASLLLLGGVWVEISIHASAVVRVQHLAQREPCAQYACSATLKPNNLYRTFSIIHLNLFNSEVTKVQTKVPRDYNVRI